MPLQISKLMPLGDSALVVEFEQVIDERVHDQVLALQTVMQNAIDLQSLVGVRSLVPAYCSLTINYDPLEIDPDRLRAQVASLAAATRAQSVAGGKLWTVPVCYDSPLESDMEVICQHTGLARDEIIRLHTAQPYRVFMLGFLPGFAYLGSLPTALECPRKSTIRTRVPAGAVAIAGGQTAIYPAESPGGWQILGHTNWRPLDLDAPQEGDGMSDFRLRVGDTVQFQRVEHGELRR